MPANPPAACLSAVPDYGQVTDVATATSLGPMLDGYYDLHRLDKALGRLYLLTDSRTSSADTQLESYHAAALTLVGTERLPRFQIQSIRRRKQQVGWLCIAMHVDPPSLNSGFLEYPQGSPTHRYFCPA